MDTEIYLDNNATTRPLPAVRSAMVAAMDNEFGNPSSVHTGGDRGRALLERARDSIGRLVGADSGHVLFTSGGTEANNLVLHSATVGQCSPRIVTTVSEHSSILRHCEHLAAFGVEIELLPVDLDGLLDLDHLRAALSRPASLVSVNWVNNETGVVQPVPEIAQLCQSWNTPFHTDAAQAAGKLPIRFDHLAIDFLTLTGHKWHGPMGVGALVARHPNDIRSLLFGGDQEFGLRAGTENLPGIVGLGRAAELRVENFEADCTQLEELRDEFERRILAAIPDVCVNGVGAARVCNTSNLRFAGVDGQALVARLDQAGIRCSQSSACTNQRPEPSYVLRAMGLSEAEAYASVRFGFSCENTYQEVDRVVEVLIELCRQLRQFGRSPSVSETT